MPYMMFDPLYFIMIIPATLLALGAQFWLKSAYASGQAQPARMNGAQTARMILDHNGLSHVPVEMSQGHLSDHYDPTADVVRLSPEVYHNASLASVGIAAHEVGHALQKATNYAPLTLRSAAVPLAAGGGNLSMILIMLGIFLGGAATVLGKSMVLLGILLFSGVVVFQLITLPVEFNASRRAKQEIAGLGIVSPQEAAVVSRVLTAAAMTYVAATVTAVSQLLYYLIRSGLLGGRNDD